MNNDLLLGQLGMSSLLSRRAEHSVVFLFKLIHGLVDCSDLLSQVTFKVNVLLVARKTLFFFRLDIQILDSRRRSYG
jgi:hypothetical protein